MSTVHDILDQARWAPSGDNMQTWRFEIVDERQLVIHGYDTREHCIYDLQGHASQLAIGALLETLDIAAARHGLRAEAGRRSDDPPGRLTYDVTLQPDPTREPDPLESVIQIRATQRRPMQTTPLTPEQKQALEASVPKPFRVHWVETPAERRRLAWLLFRSARIRLTAPEAFPTHQSIIEWNARYSEDRIPDTAVGLDPLATRLMQWSMGSWERVHFLNTFLAGTVLPRIQLDLLPGMRCAAHFLLYAPESGARGIEEYVAGGRAWQRFWLTATAQGLWGQPEMTPLIFSEYVRDGISFTRNASAQRLAEDVRRDLKRLVGAEVAEHALVMGRLGGGPAPQSRSLRLPLDRLLMKAG